MAVIVSFYSIMAAELTTNWRDLPAKLSELFRQSEQEMAYAIFIKISRLSPSRTAIMISLRVIEKHLPPGEKYIYLISPASISRVRQECSAHAIK